MQRGTSRLLVVVIFTCVVVLMTGHHLSLGAQIGQLPSRIMSNGGNMQLLGQSDRLSSADPAGMDPATRYVSLRGDERIPQSKYIIGVAGFSYFDNLYFFNGTFYFVSDNPQRAGMPEVGPSYIITGDINAPGNTMGRNAATGPDRWQTITTARAEEILGGNLAIRESGISMFFNDEDGPNGINSMLGHYYHCEMFLGAWRLCVAAGNLQLPARIMYRAKPYSWRDRARITPWFQDTILAGTAIEESFHLQDRKESGMTYLYEKIAILDRAAAHRHGKDPKWWGKAAADLTSLEVPINWLEPLRDRIVIMSDKLGCSVERAKPNVPVVTYIDRQLTGRRLVSEDHDALLAAMRALEKEGVIEFIHAQMENIARHEQFCMAARTDIMLGVHGNGLSHQLWMLPGAAVIEIMEQEGFTRDYAILAEFMSHEYCALHNDNCFPRSKWRQENGWMTPQSPGFHGSKIRADAAYLSDMVRDMAARRRHGPKPFKW